MSSSKNELLSAAMKRTSEWLFSLEVPSDVTVRVGSSSFSLHKFPLVSKCGYIRKLLSQPAEANLPAIEINDLAGGAEAFDYAIKFCYGVNFEMNVGNVAMLRCVAEQLEMTEECAVGNLVGRTEAYLSEVALKSLSGAVSVLSASESLLPVAENIKLVRRCIDAVAYLVCKEAGSRARVEALEGSQQREDVDWWVRDLTRLKIEFFRRVLVAMMARGFKQSALGPVLMLFAQNTLRLSTFNVKLVSQGSNSRPLVNGVFGKAKGEIDPGEEQEKRLVLETIVSLLPKETNALPVSFLSMLLRSSIYLDTTVACRLDLEKRMALQLDQAALDDLLIASHSHSSGGSTLFDVDTVKRITMNYVKYAPKGSHSAEEGHVSLPPTELQRVGSLIENYLAEIASDKNLPVSKFSGLVALIPKRARVTEDGIYRAIDIFLKAHPNSSEIERRRLCGLMDCRKLSKEARAHASQNERLPVETAVQLLYHEQQRLREAMASNGNEDPSNFPLALHRTTIGRVASDDTAALQRENEELRMELLKMKTRMKELERSTDNKPPLPRKSLMDSVSKKLGKLIPLARGKAMAPGDDSWAKLSRDRRHSIS